MTQTRLSLGAEPTQSESLRRQCPSKEMHQLLELIGSVSVVGPSAELSPEKSDYEHMCSRP
jgi:hypothetical protein